MGEQQRDESKRDDDAWIEKVVDTAGALGFNKMRVRWKLIRWQESRRKARRWREQRIAHISYQHKICHECGAVQDRDEAICTQCGAKLSSRALQVLQRIGLTTPEFLSMSTVLVLVLIGVHLRIWLAAGTGAFSLPSRLLIDFGGRYPPLLSDEPWRLLTAIFLHAGLVHLGFNVLALASIGPRVEELYGRLTLLLLFVVTGTLANLGSVAIGLGGVGIGASGGIMGLAMPPPATASGSARRTVAGCATPCCSGLRTRSCSASGCTPTTPRTRSASSPAPRSGTPSSRRPGSIRG
jgi:membrane associated rhomboid family serine protease